MTQKFKTPVAFETTVTVPAPVGANDIASKGSAQAQADAAQSAAEATASTDATTKANAAQAAAATDATTKANAAQAAAEATAATDATTKADAALAAAIVAADAAADAAEAAAIAAAATDATTKANTAESNATAAAATDATTKANAAQAAAATDATTKANAAQAAAQAAAATDATTKANAALASANTYTDATRQGMFPKANVKAATTAALPASTATATTLTADANGAFANQDDIPIGLNETVLVKDEALLENNGPYKLTQVGSAGTPWILTRQDDFNTSAKAKSGSYLGVQQGTVYADQQWQMITDTDPFVLGTTAQVWQALVLALDFSASNGAVRIGNDIQVVTEANRTVINGNGAVDIDTDLLPSPIAGDAGKRLQATGADTAAWTTIPTAAPGVQGELAAADATALFAVKPKIVTATLADNQVAVAKVAAALDYAAAAANGSMLDVVMKRGTTNIFMGRLTIVNNDDGSSRDMIWQGNELGAIGITFSIQLNSGNIELYYTSTNTGFSTAVAIHQVSMKA